MIKKSTFTASFFQRLVFAFLALSLLITASPAQAQDWSASDDRKSEIIKRYKILLERNPTEGLAFKKLLDYVGTGKGLARLVDEYRKKVESKPDNARYRLILGHFLKASNDYEAALAEYEKAVELDGGNPLTWISRGSVHLVLQHDEEAAADFEKALSLEKNRDQKQDILRKLADLAFNSRDWDKAQEYYDQLVKLDPRNEFLRLEYAQVLIKYKRYEKALGQYQALLKLAGRDTKAKGTTLRDMGDLYEKMGKDDDALTTYRSAMKLVRTGNWLHRELRQRIVGVYRRTDRLQELVESYEKSWRSPNYDQSMELAALYDELGREDDAVKYYRRAMSKNRRSVDPRMRLIQILERRGDEKKVLAEYRSLIKIAPKQARFQFDLVRLHFRMGDRKAAEKLLKKIESRFRRDADVHVMLADTFMRFDMQKDALRIYKKLVRMDPRNDGYILGLGEYYYQAGEQDEAVRTWVKLLDSSLEEAEAHARLGQVLAEHGMVDKGLKHFEKAVEIAPKDINVRRGLALAYERARRWAQAVTTWTWILDNADQPFTSNEARGRIINIYRRQNRLRTKMREFRQAFESRPPDLKAGFFLAESFTKLGDFDDAEKVYDRLSSLAASDDDKNLELDALLSLQKLYQQMSAWEKAIATLQRLAELQPKRSKEYYHQIAELSLKLYADDQAVHYATLAVQLNPDDAMAQARLGDIYHKMQKYESAAAQYRAAIDLDPRAFDIQMRLADILSELGQFGEAEKLYRSVTKKATDEGLIGKAARNAMRLAEIDGRLEEVEADFYPLVYRTPPKPIYRKIVLEIFEWMTTPLVQVDRYGVANQRGEVKKELDAIGQRALPVLIDALQSRDVGQRALAVKLLGDLRQGNGALAVARIVDDPADQLRILAALTVAQIGDPRAAAPLIRATEDTDPTIRELSIWALGAVGGDSATRKLKDVLANGQSWREQSLAAIGLGRIGGDEAVEELVGFYDTLGNNRYADYIAVALVWALGRTGDPSTVNILADALTRGSDRVAGVAAWSLARVQGDEALSELLGAYWSGDRSTRERAGRGLALFAANQTDTSGNGERARIDEVRQEIRLIDDRERQVDVESILRSLEERASIAVAVADAALVLEKHRTVIVAAARKVMIGGHASDVFRDLTDASGSLGLGPLPISALKRDVAVAVAKDLRGDILKFAGKEGPARAYAVGVIAAMALPEDRAVLEAWAKESDADIKVRAVQGLARYDGSDVRDILVSALGDGRFDVRVAAANALGQVFKNSADARAVGALEKLFKDDHESVRAAAIRALGDMKSKSSVTALVQELGGARVPVMVEILRALRAIGGPDALKAVNAYSRHSDPRVRAASGGP